MSEHKSNSSHQGNDPLKMDEEDILKTLREESALSIGAHEGQLAEDIERLNDFYHGKPYGNEVEGKSKFVTREVYETVESIMPYLIKVFFSSDKACIFEPEDEDDVESSIQETEYVNWVFYRNNPGFLVGYSWLKDGLMNRVGYVKAVREKAPPKRTELENQTDEQVQLILADMEEDFLGDIGIVDQGDGLTTVILDEGEGEDKTVISNIPPEEMRISDGDKELQTARYVAHHSLRTLSDIRAMGFELDDDIADNEDVVETSTVKLDRMEDVDDGLNLEDNREGSAREVMLKEEYIFLDVDGDGIQVLWQFMRVGDTILHQERVDERPYYSWTPVITPHKHHGGTPADPVMEIQLLKSKVTRNLLDNQERLNNGRYAVVDGQVNLDDLIESSAAGVVRQQFKGAVEALPTPEFGSSAFDVLTYADTLMERRTGVSERGQGLDPKQFNSNTELGTAEIVMSAAEQKIELIARIFAETGLKDLFLGVHRLGLKHEKPDRKIRNNNGEFIAISPKSWRNRYDMTVTVGIGNGSKNQQMFQLRSIEESVPNIVKSGGLGTLVTPSNIFNLAMEKTRVAGRKDGKLFFTKPKSDEIDQGPSVDEQVKLKEVQVKEMEAKIKAGKLKLDEAKLSLEARDLQFKERQHKDENKFRLAELALEAKQDRAVKLGNE